MAKKKKKKKFKIKKAPLIVVIILLIIIGLFMHFNSKTYLFTKAYNKTIDMKMESYKELKNKFFPYVDDKYMVETDTTFNYNENNNKIDGKIYLDGSNNYFDLTIKQNDEEKKFSIINKDNKTYYKVKDEYYYINNSNSFELSENEVKDTVSKYFKKYIKKGSLSKKKETVKYDKTYKTKKLTLKLSNKEYYNFLLDVLNDKNIKKAFNTDKYIKDIEKKKKEEKTIKNYFKYSIYTYKGKPILEEYEIDDNKLEVSIFNNNNYKHIKIKTEDNKKGSYIIIKDNKIDLFFEDYMYGEGTITDNSIDIKFTDYDKNEIGNLSYKIEKNGKKYIITFKMKTNLNSLKLNIDVNNIVDTNKSIPSLDLKDAKSITNASSEDLEKLRELLSN